MSDATYTFVAAFRRGLADLLTVPDNPADPDATRAAVTATVSTAWTGVNGTPGSPLKVTREVRLVGPGDVRRLQPDTVLRCHPSPGDIAAAAGELAYIEFYDEDLPWRLTPAAPVTVRTGAVDGPRLRPWLALFVLEDDEGSVVRRRDLPDVLTVAADAALPPPGQAWAWAHAQLTGAVPDEASAGPAAEAAPDTALSRLLSPRRLAPDTAYTAYLVPAFDTGRIAGLGDSPVGVPAQRPSWGPDVADRRFPVYHSWAFATGPDGGFEDLVRKLRARPVGPEFGSREARVDTAAGGLPDGTLGDTIRVEGALRPPVEPGRPEQRDPYPTAVPGTAGVDALRRLLDRATERLRPGAALDDDPVLVPVVYGGRPAGVELLSQLADGDDASWVLELNLDLRNRAAAGLGARVVRERQDELMARAWQQVGRLRDANRRLREAELALAAAQAAFSKHLKGSDPGRLLLLTAPAHGGLAAPADPDTTLGTTPVRSVLATVDRSRVPTAVEDQAFRRVTRPDLPLLRTADGAGTFRTGLVTRMDADPAAALSASPPVAPPKSAVGIGEVLAAADAAVAGLAQRADAPKRVLLTLLLQVLDAVPAGSPVPDAGALQTALTPLRAAWRAAHPDPAGTEAADGLDALAAAITGSVAAADGGVRVTVTGAVFAQHFGTEIAGKALRYLVVVSDTPPGTKIARSVDPAAAEQVRADVSAFRTELSDRLGEVPPGAPLGPVDQLAHAVLAGMAPGEAVYRRVITAVPDLEQRLTDRAATSARRLRPVLAYPQFPDPTVDALRAISQEHVLPNISALPPDTTTLMQPNGRFVESYLAGLNTEFARELLWREFPTDQRGTPFQVFWDRRDALDRPTGDAGADVPPLPEWTAPLGRNGGTSRPPLVLVLRSDLVRRFPNLVVTAHPAIWTGTPAQGRRTLDPAAAPRWPLFTSTLEPDVALFGFALGVSEARGHVPAGPADPEAADPGWFFVLQERPGQPRFGLDETAGDGYDSWDDLAWPDLAPGGPTPTYLDVDAPVAAPADPEGATWAATSADLASILLRNPVMYARHADRMLPREAS